MLRLNGLIKGVHIVRSLTAGLLLLNIVLLYAIFLAPQGILGYQQQCRQVEQLEAKVLKLKRENHRIFHRIKAFRKDPLAQEKLVREQLGWARSNELVVEFTAPKKSGQAN